MSSAWQNYVVNALERERSILLSDEEKEVVNQVEKALQKVGQSEAWKSFTDEQRLNIVRGFWSRSNRVRDIVDTTIEIARWRKENNIDRIMDHKLPLHDLYHKSWPTYLAGEDIYGHWFILERVEELDVSVLAKHDIDTILQYRAQMLETLMRIKRESSLRLGYRVAQYIYCLDLKGLSVQKHFTLKVRALLQPLFKVSGDYYPDTLWNLFLVNAPMAFRMIWRIISPWIDPEVKLKIRILSGMSAYLPAMLKTNIPVESIPEVIGGNCKTIHFSDIMDDIFDSPDVEDHGWIQNTTTPDPKVQQAHQKQLEMIENGANKRASLPKRLSRSLTKGLRRKTGVESRPSEGSVDSSDGSIIEDGELIYNGDDVLMSGYMSKTGWINKAWRRRYFVLTEKGLFYFSSYPTKESHRPSGKIELNMIFATEINGDGSDGLIRIRTPNRVYNLRIDAEEDHSKTVSELTRTWSEAISLAVENHLCAIDVEAVAAHRHEDHLYKGYLNKRGVFNFTWNRRYALLTSHAVYYYTDMPTNIGSSLRGRIDLLNIEGCEQDDKFPSNFTITVPGKVYQFRTESKTSASKWAEEIKQAIAEEQRRRRESMGGDVEDRSSTNGGVDPPMIRSLDGEDGDVAAELGRSSSTMVEQLAFLAEEFFTMAGDMGILLKGQGEGGGDQQVRIPDPAEVSSVIRKRVMHMFKLF